MKRPSSLHVTESDLAELGQLLRATGSPVAWRRHPDRELYARVWHLLECLPGPEGQWRGHALMALSTRNPAEDARAPDEPEEPLWNRLLAEELLGLIEKALVRRHLEWEEINAEERFDLLMERHSLEKALDGARPIIEQAKAAKEGRAKGVRQTNAARSERARKETEADLAKYDQYIAEGSYSKREIVGKITKNERRAKRLRAAVKKRALGEMK